MGAATVVDQVDAVAGYAAWASAYDEPGNALIDLEEPVVRRVFDDLPVGTVLDAACGTGRHAEFLHGAGHRVLGVDDSPEMLARARERVRAARVRGAAVDERRRGGERRSWAVGDVAVVVGRDGAGGGAGRESWCAGVGGVAVRAGRFVSAVFSSAGLNRSGGVRVVIRGGLACGGSPGG